MDEADLPSLGAAIRESRQALGMTLRDLSALTRIDLGLLSRIETGAVRTPGMAAISRIATVLNLPLTDLFGLLDERARAELPPLQPYLRAKYDLPDHVIQQITDYLTRYGGGTGPADGEDERDDITI